VTSEEELDDEMIENNQNEEMDDDEIIGGRVEIIKASESSVVVVTPTKYGYENHIEKMSENLHKNTDEKKEKRRASGLKFKLEKK